MNTSVSKILEWDSEFFGFKVGRIVLGPSTSDAEVSSMITDLLEQGCRFIDIFSPVKLDLAKYSAFNIKLTDGRRSYLNPAPVDSQSGAPEGLTIQEFAGEPAELYELGIQAGEHSRYKTDSDFPDELFEKLYRKWIDNSVNLSFADNVWIASLDGIVVGFVTTKNEEEYISMQLLATDSRLRGKGIGTCLTRHVFGQASRQGLGVQLTTQVDNTTACRLYENLGFKIQSDSYIYHVHA